MPDFDWTAGYVADIDYTYGYYPELNPLRVKLAFLQAGLVCPEFGQACELGFGQGVSTNIHAAAAVQHWYGTDFNPAQASHAQELAASSGAAIDLHDDAFADFARRSDLPDFDFIGLHGIWSWVSDDNRRVLVDFIRRKLKVGGVLYISYNTQPGWAAFAPMRHLFNAYADTLAAPGQGLVDRVNGALAFSQQLLDCNPAFARANPQIAERLKRLGGQNRNYLAHEFFNRDWQPMHFADMAGWLQQAKLSFACQAGYLDNIIPANFTQEQQALLNGIPDPVFRETIRDFLLNQQFRRDYWIKGARKLSPLARQEALRSLRVVLQIARANVSLTVRSALGEATMNAAIYDPVLDLLADLRAHSLAELEQALAGRGITLEQIIETVLILASNGQLGPAQDEAAISRAAPASHKLNRYLLNKARLGSEIQHLASPVTGGGVPVDLPQQLFLLARQEGLNTPEQWGEQAGEILQALGRHIVKDGQPLKDAAQSRAELLRQAQVFAEQRLPVLQALQVI
ncbi:class I SAM-dependent methyltransferase [Chitinilyticum litopenaei]|uniref:class I SAM-dependent methyltransferase n=1 Tax=Chitinilyticum litopenaei TaxID=1121276 RepID=UPI0004249D82|nr:class I SAM-dependent methyltransferase [Chitinilyticum litopenaei]